MYIGTDSYVSGGNPPDIIDCLDHDGLVQYHNRHYHPSNSLFYTYGDIHLEHTLGMIENKVLDKFADNGHRVSLSNSSVNNWNGDAGQNFKAKGPLDHLLPTDKQTRYSLDWPMPRTDDVNEHFIRKVS